MGSRYHGGRSRFKSSGTPEHISSSTQGPDGDLHPAEAGEGIAMASRTALGSSQADGGGNWGEDLATKAARSGDGRSAGVGARALHAAEVVRPGELSPHGRRRNSPSARGSDPPEKSRSGYRPPSGDAIIQGSCPGASSGPRRGSRPRGRGEMTHCCGQATYL